MEAARLAPIAGTPWAIEASLDRLQTDRIDFDATTTLRECLEAIAPAIRAGRIGAAGCSNVSAERLQAALDCASARGSR